MSLCARCRFSHAVGQKVAEMTTPRVCKSHVMDVNSIFDNAPDQGATQGRQAIVAELGKEGQDRLRDLQMPSQADQIKWQSLLLQDDELDQHARFAMAPIGKKATSL